VYEMSYDDSYDRRRRSPPRYDDRRGPPPPRDYDRGSGGYNGPPKRPYQAPMYDRPPPPKRVRDWGEDTYDPVMPKRQSEPEEPKAKMAGPILMSFKQFLATQDDSITDEDAIKKYNDYKLEYKRQQLHQFFIEHKDEEWSVIIVLCRVQHTQGGMCDGMDLMCTAYLFLTNMSSLTIYSCHPRSCPRIFRKYANG
jgi:hypothetical protein